jgi:hypothetical protein
MTVTHWSVLALLVSHAAVLGQSAKNQTAQKEVEVRFANGSSVRMVLFEQTIELTTPAGKASIPIKDVQRIDFGIHMPRETEAKIQAAVKALGSDRFQERDEAQNDLLGWGRLAVPGLSKVAADGELEVMRRARSILKRIQDKVPTDELQVNDHVTTRTGTVVGRIMTPSLKLHSEYFGNVDPPLHQLRAMRRPEAFSQRAPRVALVDLLDETFDMKEMQAVAEGVRFKDCLDLLREKLRARGKDLPIVIDFEAFRAEVAENDADKINNETIKFPPYPKTMKLGQILRSAVDQLPFANFLLRKGVIEITSRNRTSIEALLELPITARYDKRPLDEALHELAESSGLSILVDPRAATKAKTPVSATFRNNTKVEMAVRLLAESAGLKAHVDNDTLVITPEPKGGKAPKKRELRLTDRPLELAFKDLAAWSDTSIVVDSRLLPPPALVCFIGGVFDFRAIRVSAVFKANVSPEAAARVLANQADLTVVSLDNLLFITTAQSASKILQEKAGKFKKQP